MKIMLSGIGGAMIEKVEEEINKTDDCEISCGIGLDVEKNTKPYVTYSKLNQINESEEIDVIIDFSHFSFTSELVSFAMEKKIPLVLCTTGILQEDIEKIKEASNVIPIVKSANMSIGVNVINQILKEVTNRLYSEGFDIEIIEKHHNKKIDAPSGTAKLFANTMKKEIEKQINEDVSYKYDRTKQKEKREKNEIGISSLRGGSIVGEHEIIFAGDDEIIEIKHTALSKKIFAKGALKAAKWITCVKPGLYDMKNILN